MVKNTESVSSAFVEYLQSAEQCLLPPALEPQSGSSLSAIDITRDTVRFYRIDELSAEEEGDLQQAMENVIAGLTNASYRWIYYLVGTATGVEFYLGVVQTQKQEGLPGYATLLTSLFKGNFMGAQLSTVRNEELDSKIIEPLRQSQHFGLIGGVPSRYLDKQGALKPNTSQGIDRLTNSLLGEEWQLIITAEPATEEEANRLWHQLLKLASELPSIKISERDEQAQSNSRTEEKNKRVSHSFSRTEKDEESESTSKTESEEEKKSENKQDITQGNKRTENGSPSDCRQTNKEDSKTTSRLDIKGKANNKNEIKSKNNSKTVSKIETDGNDEIDSVEKNTGKFRSDNRESVNKTLARIGKHLDENLLERIELGRSKGLFKTAIYVAARSKTVYDRLSRGMIAIFQGNQSLFSPLHVYPFNLPEGTVRATHLFGLSSQKATKEQLTQATLHSIPTQNNKLVLATWLNTSELALLAGLPSRELPGMRLRDNVDFAVNVTSPANGVTLGYIVQHGRELTKNVVRLDNDLLNKHIFITGVTGAGKTTTCQQILLGSGLPFLVIEPAKTEYRTLMTKADDIQFYTLGVESISPFRFNPFELLRGERLSGHIDMLKATLAGVFPMEAAMPYLIEEAIVRSYQNKGWDIHNDSNEVYADPWDSNGDCWPILSEMLVTLKEVVASKNFGLDLQQKYEGSLIARLDNLTVGAKGRMLNTRNSLDVDVLLNQKVVIELEELRDESDKALMMGLLIGRVAEAMKQRHKLQPDFRHLTLVEEAHRLLGKPDPSEGGAKRLGINLFANLLAEVRKYGEGLIIADQIPNKLTPEVMKNTNTKIVHRLFAADDRHAIGDTISLDDEQKDFLSMLNTGEAIIYSAGWHKAARVKIIASSDTSGTLIDEDRLRQQGMRRLWLERQRLYPRVAGLHDWPETGFGDMIHQGLRCLELWVKWVRQLQGNNPKAMARWVKSSELQRLTNEMGALSVSVNVSSLLVALFQDGLPVAYPETQQVSSNTTYEAVLHRLFAVVQNESMPSTFDDVFVLLGAHCLNDVKKIFGGLYAV